MMQRKTWMQFGHYKMPLLYYALCQRWYNARLARQAKLPKLSGKILVLNGEFFFNKGDWESLRRATRQALEVKDVSFFSSYVAMAERVIHAVEDVVRQARNAQPTGKVFARLFGVTHDLQFPWGALLPMAIALEQYAADELGFTPDQLLVLFQPHKTLQIFRQQQELAALRAYRGAKRRERIKRHAQKYAWIGMLNFWGTPLTEQQVREQLRVIKSRPPVKQVALKGFVLTVGADFSYYRQRFAEACARTSLAVHVLLEKLAKQTQIKHDDFLLMTPDELLQGIKTGIFPPLAVIQERRAGFGLIPEKPFIMTGRTLEQMRKKFLPRVSRLNEIHGQVASRGKATGTVRVALSPKDVVKIHAGDILVSPETTPDFLPAMHKTAAIVTDVGGLTSHAAIVSRELKIPCVIGTKIATKVLKDGDLVEVDANKGIVKIIQRRR